MIIISERVIRVVVVHEDMGLAVASGDWCHEHVGLAVTSGDWCHEDVGLAVTSGDSCHAIHLWCHSDVLVHARCLLQGT